MKPKKELYPKRSRRRTADQALLADDIAKVQALIAAGMSPFDALTAFRAGFSADNLSDAVAHVRRARSAQRGGCGS